MQIFLYVASTLHIRRLEVGVFSLKQNQAKIIREQDTIYTQKHRGLVSKRPASPSRLSPLESEYNTYAQMLSVFTSSFLLLVFSFAPLLSLRLD